MTTSNFDPYDEAEADAPYADGGTHEGMLWRADRKVAEMSVLPLPTGPLVTPPSESYTRYPFIYGTVWMHDDHDGVEFQVNKCENAGTLAAEQMGEAWLRAHPGGVKGPKWGKSTDPKWVIRYYF